MGFKTPKSRSVGKFKLQKLISISNVELYFPRNSFPQFLKYIFVGSFERPPILTLDSPFLFKKDEIAWLSDSIRGH